MASPKALKDKFFKKVINPYLAGVLQHPQSIEMREVVLHIRDVEGPKKTGSVEARLEAMEQQVFKCQGMVERGLNANHMMITEFTNKHKIDANDIGKHLSRLYDKIDHLQAQIYDVQNQNCLDDAQEDRGKRRRPHAHEKTLQEQAASCKCPLNTREEVVEAYESHLMSREDELSKHEEEVLRRSEAAAIGEANAEAREREFASFASTRDGERERVLVKKHDLAATHATLNE
ncbi:40S ribosomal protein S5-1 [Hordeum vulgare]|nr:40S ribosomal protein S5-1 [Hordeum vulgare]